MLCATNLYQLELRSRPRRTLMAGVVLFCTLTTLCAPNVMRCTMSTHEHCCSARALHAAKPPLLSAPGTLTAQVAQKTSIG